MKRRFRYCLMAVCCCLSLSLASCGGDDEPDLPDTPGTEQGGSASSNPMAGTTITCREHSSNSGMVIDTNFSITFLDASRYRQILKQSATDHGNLIQSLDKEIIGSYKYEGNSIVLTPDDGGRTVLQKVDGGWQDGSYIYK